MSLFSNFTDRPARPQRGSADTSTGADPTRIISGRRAGTRGSEPAGAAATSLLKRYRPLETRATGGFGSVEICLDARLQRRVAIKRIPLSTPTSTTPEDVRAAALAEARTASMLQHPNIVSVIDFTYDDAYAYLVMEYIDGMSLEEFLAQVEGNSLTYDECACIADALTQALAYAHENGVLHMDIKPGNVLIDRSGHVKLADFGMATLTSAAGFGGARGGTIGYMPPEQLAGDMVDERTDIFALGCVLYESLCATSPFRAATPADSLKRIAKGVVRPASLLPDMPQDAEDALLSALAADPAERLDSVAEFADLFLDNLGDAREGRRSLARIIARLTSDEVPDDEDAPGRGGKVWELDPAEGWLGSRTPNARRIACGAVAGVSVCIASLGMLSHMGMAPGLAQLLGAAAIGLAAGIAPQIGSALLACCFALMVAGSTELLPLIATLIVFMPCFAGWWYAWGRTRPAASAVLCALVAAGIATQDALVLAGPVAALASYLLAPVPAAASVAGGVLFARLASAALMAGGSMGGAQALDALADPWLWAGVLVLAGASAVSSMLLARLWSNVRDARGTGLLVLPCILFAIVVVLLLWLANPMENAGIDPAGPLAALGSGALSSIILGICVSLFGYRKDLSEGDRL